MAPARPAKTLGERLRDARTKKGITQVQLAKLAGLPVLRVQRLEAGGGNGAALIAAFGALGWRILPVPHPGQHARTIQSWKIKKAKPTTTYFTPEHIWRAVLRAFGRTRFCLDVASPTPPTVPCVKFYTEDDDGLAHDWFGDVVWCNGPYDEPKPWCVKAVETWKARHVRCIVMLWRYHPSTSYQKMLRAAGARVIVLHDQLKFGGWKVPATFTSAFYILGVTDDELARLRAELPENDVL